MPLNLARPATAPTEASSGYAEFVVDATANSAYPELASVGAVAGLARFSGI